MAQGAPLIIWPAVAMAVLIFVVWGVLVRQRMTHIRTNPPTKADFADKEAAGRYFRPVEKSGSNFANLFETPVLFFALIPLLLQTGQAGAVQVVLAWLFVAFRVAHSAIHIGPNKVLVRFYAYLGATLSLMAMWLWFAISLALGL